MTEKKGMVVRMVSKNTPSNKIKIKAEINWDEETGNLSEKELIDFGVRDIINNKLAKSENPAELLKNVTMKFLKK